MSNFIMDDILCSPRANIIMSIGIILIAPGKMNGPCLSLCVAFRLDVSL